ncbi:methyl-accepting chemotaxis protein [Paucibacter sp. DJ2R-2]|uniref:methyl-accepting chemotaxis protein n=1 Tax=Paucibacter sp. DJ2R-2 TaxID=2893558 RepID=UPI0021E43967|nr:methyl-accepting chemotaxis protein [Paucibacter sp. DJ2R-2]MCV2438657.1 methyl-accepting chemotaxis protein [Paucibacter sp. DJ2R-2]
MLHWINDQSMARKFVLIGALAFCMTAVPTWIAIKSHSEDIAMADAEARGLAPAGDMLRLVRLTQQHRGITALALSGKPDAAKNRSLKQAEVELALAKAIKSSGLLKSQALNAELARINTGWDEIATALGRRDLVGPASFRAHTSLIEQELAALENVVYVSSMHLDPSAASYYLISAVLMHAPQLSESLGRMRAVGVSLLAKGQASPEERMRLQTLVETARVQLDATARDFKRSVEADASLGPALTARHAAAASAAQEAIEMVDRGILKPTELTMPAADYLAATTRIIDTQFAFIEPAFEKIEKLLSTQVADAKSTVFAIAALVLMATTLGFWLMWTVARATSRAIGSALALAKAVAAGDLTSDVGQAGRDELGQLLGVLQLMNGSLVKLVTEIRLSAESVSTGSTEIAEGNSDLSQRTETQASSLQETAASMEELTATVRENSDSSQQATELAESASEAARSGQAVVAQVIETMHSISAASGRIAEITSIIDALAFQTNILALNAAVEAARAGEHGRGFAVVAAEVRTLAQRSATSAREIKELISSSSERVDAGTKLAAESGHAMHEIVGRIAKVSTLVSQIRDSSSEQAQGIAQVGEAVSHLDTVTQQNAALVEESAAAAESLRLQAEGLTDLVSTFRIGLQPI